MLGVGEEFLEGSKDHLFLGLTEKVTHDHATLSICVPNTNTLSCPRHDDLISHVGI